MVCRRRLQEESQHGRRPGNRKAKRSPGSIEDTKKMFYYRGLSEWEHEKGYLTDTCLDGQDTFKKLMAMFDIQA